MSAHFGLCTILPLPILYLESNNWGPGENHRLRNIDCKIQRGGVATKEALNAKNSIA